MEGLHPERAELGHACKYWEGSNQSAQSRTHEHSLKRSHALASTASYEGERASFRLLGDFFLAFSLD